MAKKQFDAFAALNSISKYAPPAAKPVKKAVKKKEKKVPASGKWLPASDELKKALGTKEPKTKPGYSPPPKPKPRGTRTEVKTPLSFLPETSPLRALLDPKERQEFMQIRRGERKSGIPDMLKQATKDPLGSMLIDTGGIGVAGTLGRAGKSVIKNLADDSLGLADIKISSKLPKAAIKDRASAAISEIKSDYLNRFQPIEDLTKGKKLAPSKNPATLLKRYSGGMGIANQKIDSELTPIIRKTKNFDDLRKYLVAERSNELAERGIGKRADRALLELKTKVGDQEYANFQGIADELYGYQNKIFTQLKEVGVLSDEAYNAITSANQKYVPFNRVMDELESSGFIPRAKDINVKTSGIKKIKGSEREIIDPIESMINNTYSITKTVEKQRVLNALVDLGETSGEMKRIGGKGGLIEPSTPHITLFKNGQKTYYETSKEIADTISGLNEEQLNLAIQAMSIPARIMRAGATGLNVGFAVPNIVRDQLSAAVNSKYGGIPIYDFISGLASTIKKDKHFQDWILSGADQASFFSQDRTMLQRTVKDVTGGKLARAGRVIKNPLELLRAFGEYSEKGSRVGVYKRATKGAEGKLLLQKLHVKKNPKRIGFDAQLDAMEQSREATIDFARRGSKMKSINAIIPFLNARLQGSLKLVESAKKRPVQTLLTGGAIASVPAAVLYAHNSQYPEYDDIPQYIKDTYFVIMTGDKDVPFYKIPKGEIGQIFGNPVENFMAHVKGNDEKAFAELVKDVLVQISPVDNIGSIMPTAFKVPIELMANYDTFRKRNIVSPYQKDMPPELQFDAKTAETSKWLGDKMNVSPAKLEHALSGYTAGLGRQALQLSDKLAFGKTPEAANLPVLDRFIGEPKDLSAVTQKMYEQLDKNNRTKSRENYDLKEALKKGDDSGLIGLSKQRANALIKSSQDQMIKDALPSSRKVLYGLGKSEREKLYASDPELASKLVTSSTPQSIKGDANNILESAAENNWTNKMVAKALETLHPFYGMSMEEQQRYIKSLDDGSKDKLRSSLKYWEQTILPKMVEVENTGQ